MAPQLQPRKQAVGSTALGKRAAAASDASSPPQHALRLAAFGQLHKVLGMDPLPSKMPKKPKNENPVDYTGKCSRGPRPGSGVGLSLVLSPPPCYVVSPTPPPVVQIPPSTTYAVTPMKRPMEEDGEEKSPSKKKKKLQRKGGGCSPHGRRWAECRGGAIPLTPASVPRGEDRAAAGHERADATEPAEAGAAVQAGVADWARACPHLHHGRGGGRQLLRGLGPFKEDGQAARGREGEGAPA